MYGYPQPPPPPYAMLNGPQYYPPPRRKKANNCCRCICCFCCFFVMLFVIQILTVLYFYISYDPKAPSYAFENIDIKSIDLKPDSTLTTNIHVDIRAENPNKHVEFIYGDGSDMAVEYSTVRICAGKLPAFRQGRENTTIIKAELKGVSNLGPGIQDDLMENRKNHRVPLMVRMKVPINVIVGETTLREFKVFVNCSLVVDGLSPGNSSQIISRETSFHLQVGG